MPNPPTSLTAFTRRAPAMAAIGADRIGCLIPSSEVSLVSIAIFLPKPQFATIGRHTSGEK